MGDSDFFGITASRRGPPHPLGPDARYYPYSATTPQSQIHQSGLQLRIKLATPHPTYPFGTGELIEGNVIISKPGGKIGSKVAISSLTLRAYFEARTLFWHFGLAQPKNELTKTKAKVTPKHAQEHEHTIGHELHRGLVPRKDMKFTWADGKSMNVELDGMGPDGDAPQTTLPFTFKIPTRMRVDQCNECLNAPRDLCNIDRCPPPSFPDSPVASVQWIAEGVLTLDDDLKEPVTVDERLFKLPNRSNMVTRIVFPVLPADSHGQDLTLVKHFGAYLTVDPFGAVVSWEGKADAVERLKGKGGEWRTYTKVTKLNSLKLLSAETNLISEISMPQPAIIQRSALNIPLVLSIRLDTPPSKGFMKGKPLKEVHITKAMVSLKRQLSTRGGRDVDPHLDIDFLRSDSFFPGGSAAEGGSTTKAGLVVRAGEGAKVWEITFDLQREGLMSGGSNKQNTKASSLTPSFRVPNIQLEYVLSIMITVEGQGDFSVVAFPLQLLTGDSAELPSFEEATGLVHGRDDNVPPAYVALP